MLFEIFSQQLGRCLSVLHDDFAVFVVDRRLEEIPPPATLLEELEKESGIITSPNEAFVDLEVLAFEVEVDSIALVESLEEFDQHLLLGVADESLAAQIVVF